MKYENKPTLYAILIVLLVLLFGVLFGASCTSNKDITTTIEYVVTDKYFDTDIMNNEHCYLKVMKLSNKEITIEQLYDHQVDMYNIGDTIIVQLN